MSEGSERVKEWRKKTKERIVLSMGGKCSCCGYDKCNDALALHHLDPSKKEFTLGAIRGNPKAWEKIIIELRKCILLCHNCHCEIHSGIRTSPEVKQYFNEKYAEYKMITVKINECPVCGASKPMYNKTCSHNCAAKLSGKVNWDKIDLTELKKTMTNVQISEILDISEAAVRKRYKKYHSSVL